jgi:hypothetical protein
MWYWPAGSFCRLLRGCSLFALIDVGRHERTLSGGVCRRGRFLTILRFRPAGADIIEQTAGLGMQVQPACLSLQFEIR